MSFERLFNIGLAEWMVVSMAGGCLAVWLAEYGVPPATEPAVRHLHHPQANSTCLQ